MKIFFKIFLVFLATIVFTLPGCFDDSSDDSSNPYYVKVTVDETPVTLTAGFTEVNGYALGSFDTTDSETSIFALSNAIAYSSLTSQGGIPLGITNGIIIPGIAGQLVGAFINVPIIYYENSVRYYGTTATLNITAYGAEGGVIAGNFTGGTVTDVAGGVLTKILSSGSFSVYNSGVE